MKPQLPSSPVSIGRVLDNGFRLFLETFNASWLPALLVTLPTVGYTFWEMQMLAVPAVAATAPGLSWSSAAQVLQNFSAVSEASRPVVLIGTALLTVLLTVCTGAILLHNQAAIAGTQPISMGTALKASFKRLPGAVGLLFAVAITTMAGVIAFVVVAGMVALVLAPFGVFEPPPGPLQLFLILLAGLGYISILLFLLVKLMLAVPAFYLDGAGPFEAIGVAWRLTRRRWWRAAMILTVSAIVLYVFRLAFSLVGVGLAAVVNTGIVERVTVVALVAQLAAIVVMPVVTAVLQAMFNDFKLRDQGGDLAARAAALRQAS